MAEICTRCNSLHLPAHAPAVHRFNPERTQFKAVDGELFKTRADALQRNCDIAANA